MSTNCDAVATISIHRSSSAVAWLTPYAVSSRSLPAVCSTLVFFLLFLDKYIHSYNNILNVFTCIQYIDNLFKLNQFFSIGYPVVTLGFGFKSYVGYRMRQVSSFHQYLISVYSIYKNVTLKCSCVILSEHLCILVFSDFAWTEKTERCGKGERILSAVTATSTASRATSYVNAANTTASTVTGTRRYIDRTTC